VEFLQKIPEISTGQPLPRKYPLNKAHIIYMQPIEIYSFKINPVLVVLYLILGVGFNFLNVYYIDFGTELMVTEIRSYPYQNYVHISPSDQVMFILYDILLWPFIILRNCFAHYFYEFAAAVAGLLVGLGIKYRWDIIKFIQKDK